MHCDIRVYDPWPPEEYLCMLACDATSLQELLRLCRVIFGVAGATSENQGFLGAQQLSRMQSGAALVLLAALRWLTSIHRSTLLTGAGSAWLPVSSPSNPCRRPTRPDKRAIHCSAHIKRAPWTPNEADWKMVVADAKLIARGLPPVLRKSAHPKRLHFSAASQ